MFTGVVSWGNLSYTEVGWPHIWMLVTREVIWQYFNLNISAAKNTNAWKLVGSIFFSTNTDCWSVRGYLSVQLSKKSNAWKPFGPLSFLKFLVSPIYMQCCKPTLMCIIKWGRVNSQLHSFLNRHTLPALILQAWGVKLPMLMIYNSWW